MNGMANLPQFYQDMMRSHFVNALNQQQQQQSHMTNHLAAPSPQSPSGSSLLTPSQTNPASFPDLSKFNQYQQQQQMAAAVAAVQAHVQKQQQTQYVNQIQAQMNAVAAAAAASVANNNHINSTSNQFRANTPTNNNQMGFQYPQKSFFMPSNLDQIKSTINSFYHQQNNNQSNMASPIQSFRDQNMSKENLLLQQQDIMQQHIEQASKRHNLQTRNENREKANRLQMEQNYKFTPDMNQNSRGRGRPRRQIEVNTFKRSSPSSSPSTVSKTISPISNKSRSSSPSEYKHQKICQNLDISQSKDSTTDTVTRISTPSKSYSEACENLDIEQQSEQNSVIDSKSDVEIGDEEYQDVNNATDLSMYDEVGTGEDLNEDTEYDEHSSMKEEELNTTSSTVKTSASYLRHQTQPQFGNSSKPKGPVYDFTMQALEMSLYGYLRQTDPMFAGHAISGLRVPQFRGLPPGNDQRMNSISMVQGDSKKENLSSSSSSSNSSITTSDQAHSTKSTSNSKKSNFSIENLLTASSSSSNSSSSSLSLNQQPFNLLNLQLQQQQQQQNTAPDLDKLDLPDELQIRQSFQPDLTHYGVFCKKTVITKSTRFGPFPGKVVYPNDIKSSEDNNHMWEIFNEGRLSHFIDGRSQAGSSSGSQSKNAPLPNEPNMTTSSFNSGTNQWMIYVNCARFAQEQNLIAVQTDGEIFYEVCKDIAQGQELLVWYGDSYLQFLGIPVSLKDMTDEISEDTSENKDGYACDRCGKVFAYKYYRDKHLKYTRCVDQGDRKFPCHLCTRSFEKRDRLRIHILHVHEKHRPHKCSVCGKSFSQSSSLNKHMRVHSGERPYKCVYCNKAFTASSILRTHIRQHSGEKPFKCKYCGKAFASHAAHDSHVRRTHNITKDKEANLIL